MQTPRCTTPSVTPCTIVDDIPVTTSGWELCLLVRLVLTSRKMVLFVPRPWYRRCCQHSWQAILWLTLLSWPCKMSPSFLLLIHTHHSSIGSKPDSPVCPCFPKLFLYTWLRMYFCEPPSLSWSIPLSDATFVLRYSEPFSSFELGIERLPIRLKLPISSYKCILLSMCFMCFNSRDTFIPPSLI
jgi:hypothetical protein